MSIQNRRQREQANRRKDAIKAGLELFAKRGFDGVTMDQIAARADLTKPTLYSYFENKADLYCSIVLSIGFDVFEDGLRACTGKGLTSAQELREMRGVFRELCLGEPRKVFQLFLNLPAIEASGEGSAQMFRKIKGRLTDCLGLVESSIRQGVQRGEFLEVEATLLVQTLWALSVGVSRMQESRVLSIDADVPALFDSVTDQLFTALEKGRVRL